MNEALDMVAADRDLEIWIERALTAERALKAAEAEVETLRLAILGGEDAPGLAMSLELDEVLACHRSNVSYGRDRAEAAEAEVAGLKELAEYQRKLTHEALDKGHVFLARAESAEARTQALEGERDGLAEPSEDWRPVDTYTPMDGTHVLLRFGPDHVSEGWFEDNEDDPRPWKFIDQGCAGSPFRNGEMINGCRDGEYGPSHWKPLPSAGEAGPSKPLPTPRNGETEAALKDARELAQVFTDESSERATLNRLISIIEETEV